MEKMQELAKNELKNGNKNKCKKYLILKKRTLDKIKPLEGILSLIEEIFSELFGSPKTVFNSLFKLSNLKMLLW